ncbi:MAG: low molecular weight phosphotyrosine protein phosphatase [Pseudomonadales bacterium]|nr:low molecular weight phosphotyrosine protein phosphatase [Pseudomonadales bacterium]
MTQSVNVLFVCLGNICRSPTAHGVFAQQVERAGLAKQIQIDSCGTGDWHIGHAPDQRAASKAAEYGYDLSALRARQLAELDFERFDIILAMDQQNLQDIKMQCPPSYAGVTDLFLRYAGIDEAHEVPDPYYGGEDGFDHVVQLVERGGAALLDRLQEVQGWADRNR